MSKKTTALILFFFFAFGFTTHSIALPQPSPCVNAVFTKTGDAYWSNISLRLTNMCGRSENFQNASVTFKNTSNLNTSFWGDFGVLAYPDNSLKITSQPSGAGSYIASLQLHFPEASWANTILPNGQSITLSYGTSSAGYDPNSAIVYLNGSQPVEYGKIDIKVLQRPAVLNGYAGEPVVTLKRQDTGTTLNKVAPWNSVTTVDQLANNVSYVFSTPTITYQSNVCTGSFNPSTVVSSSLQAPVATLSYTCSALPPPPPPPPASSGRIIGYVPGWKQPPPASDLANAGYTHMQIAFGVFSLSRPGEIVSAFDSVTASYIASLHALGIKALLSLGGALTSIPNTSVDFHEVLQRASGPAAFEQTFIQSVESMMSQYGFDGIDIDVEHGLNGGGTFSQPTGDIAVLANILNQLHSRNPQMLISLTPQTANIGATSGFDHTWGNYAALIMQTYQSLSFVGIQLYNTGCIYGINQVCYANPGGNNQTFSVAMATDLLENWPSQTPDGRATGFQPYISHLRPDQVVLGYPAPNAQGASDGSPVTQISAIKNAIQCLKTRSTGCDLSPQGYMPPRAYQSIGGVFNWEVTYDQSNSFQFAKGLKACVRENNCN